MRFAGRWSVCVVLGLVASSLLAGCGVAPTSPVAAPGGVTPLGTLSGKVHGGQQSLVAAKVYVYAVGSGGYGTASASLLTAGPATHADGSGHYYVLTDGAGNFSVTGDYTCVAGTQVYVYVAGGDPGLGAGSNGAIGLLAALGECPVTKTLALTVPYVTVNEVSTVVAAYALAGFATDATHISSSGTALAATGVRNAMATALNIVDVATGTVPSVSPVGNAVLPVANIYTLANILASCVNSTGASSANCGTLFGDTGGATNTAAAAIAMAHAPFTNVSELYGLASSSGPFQPGLGTAPTDLTVALQYQTPVYENNQTASDAADVVFTTAAFDSEGNLWRVGFNDLDPNHAVADTIMTFYKYGPTGGQLVSTTVTGPRNFDEGFTQLGIDGSNNVWTGTAGGELKVSAQGLLLSPTTGYTCPGMVGPFSQAFADGGGVFVGDGGGEQSRGDIEQVWELTSGGACVGHLDGRSFLGGYIAMDSIGEVYSAAADESHIVTIRGGEATTFASVPVWLVTLDGLGNLWTEGEDAKNGVFIGKYHAGSQLSPDGGYTGGGLTPPAGIAISANQSGVSVDGANQVWLGATPCTVVDGSCVMLLPDTIVGLKNDGTPLTPSTGLALPDSEDGLGDCLPDGSGNLWATVSDGSAIEYVGLSVPVATPLLPSQLGQRP